MAFVLSSESPYADDIQAYLTQRSGAQMGTAEVTNPVSHRRTLYRLARVARPTPVLAQESVEDLPLRAAAAASDDATLTERVG